MTTQEVIDNLSAWLKEAVCSKQFLKRATVYEQAMHEGYEYSLVNPAVYEGTFPPDAAEYDSETEGAAPNVAPCIIVTCSGASTYNTKAGWIETPVTLKVQTWNPGQHGTDADGNPTFTVTADGWRDLAAFIDAIVKELANAEFPGGLGIADEIVFTLSEIEENPYYPYYRGTVEFSVTHSRRIKRKFDI